MTQLSGKTSILGGLFLKSCGYQRSVGATGCGTSAYVPSLQPYYSAYRFFHLSPSPRLYLPSRFLPLPCENTLQSRIPASTLLPLGLDACAMASPRASPLVHPSVSTNDGPMQTVKLIIHHHLRPEPGRTPSEPTQTTRSPSPNGASIVMRKLDCQMLPDAVNEGPKQKKALKRKKVIRKVVVRRRRRVVNGNKASSLSPLSCQNSTNKKETEKLLPSHLICCSQESCSLTGDEAINTVLPLADIRGRVRRKQTLFWDTTVESLECRMEKRFARRTPNANASFFDQRSHTLESTEKENFVPVFPILYLFPGFLDYKH